MKFMIENGLTVYNIPQSIRDHKIYAYPRDPNESAWTAVHQKIGQRLAEAKREVFVFNNEPLLIPFLDELKPETFISVASGFKPFKIIEQYKFNKNHRKYFLDFSATSLSYVAELVKCQSIEQMVQIAAKYSRHKDAEEITRQHLNGLIRDFFDNAPETLLNAVKAAENSVFKEVNFVMESNILSSFLNKNSHFVIWVSNAFYNNGLYFLLKPEEAEARYQQNAIEIAQKTESRLFKILDSRTFVYKNKQDKIIGILTDGGGYWDKSSAQLIAVNT